MSPPSEIDSPLSSFWGVSLPGHPEELGRKNMEKLTAIAQLMFCLAEFQDVQMLEVSGNATQRNESVLNRYICCSLITHNDLNPAELFPQLAVSD